MAPQFNREVVAVTTIIRTLTPGVAATRDTAAVAPKTQTLKPGTKFIPLSEEEFLELEAAKAISLDLKRGTSSIESTAVDGPGVPSKVTKTDDTPMTDAVRAEWVERGKKVNVNVGDNWKASTIRTKVEAGEAAAAEQAAIDAAANGGGDGNELV